MMTDEQIGMDLISHLRSFLHRKPREIIVPGNIPATLANCGGSVAQAEQFAEVMDFFARELIRLYPGTLGEGRVGCFVSAAPDGLVLTSHLAHLSGARLAAVHHEHGEARLHRHTLMPKENVVLVLDDCEGFVRLNEAMNILVHHAVHVTAVACVVNSSGRSEFSFLHRVPILALHTVANEEMVPARGRLVHSAH
jgi:hypothetical protein